MQRTPEKLGIYVHVPYCVQKCDYCDFFSVGMRSDTQPELRRPASTTVDGFVARVVRELRSRRGDFRAFEFVNTIFFGGGTPSTLPPEAIARILKEIRALFLVEPDAEITLEGNPEDLTPAYLRALTDTGVTRVNAGVQTWNRAFLESVHRYFDVERYAAILDNLGASQLAHVGIDLMYGFPGQTYDEFRSDLERAFAETAIDHVSVYSLTVEGGTAYAGNVRSGRAQPPDEELQDRIFRALPQVAGGAGFEIYEVSNYARNRAWCRHNLRYWLNEPFLGVGPGAHGYTGSVRYWNARNLDAWSSSGDIPPGASQTHEPGAEVPINLLRLALPFDPALIRELIGVQTGSAVADTTEALFQEWAAKGFGKLLTGSSADAVADDARFDAMQSSARLFQWSEQGLAFLDDRVLEMSRALEPGSV